MKNNKTTKKKKIPPKLQNAFFRKITKHNFSPKSQFSRKNARFPVKTAKNVFSRPVLKIL